MIGGYVKAYRARFDHPLFRGEKFCRGFAWDWMVAKACFTPVSYNVRGVTIRLERGQFVASPDDMAEVWNWSRAAVRRFLTRLQTDQMISQSTGHKKTIITICNYERYQSDEIEAGQSTGQSTGHKPAINRPVKEEGEEGEEGEKKKKNAGKPVQSPQQSFPLVVRGGKSLDPIFDMLQRASSPEAAKSFIAYRKKQKLALTETAAKRIAKTLVEIANRGGDPVDALGLAEERAWRGVKAEWYFNDVAKRQQPHRGQNTNAFDARLDAENDEIRRLIERRRAEGKIG